MFSDAEIMAIVTLGALFMYPALMGYIELAIWVKLITRKLKYRKYRHEQNKEKASYDEKEFANQ